MKALFTLFMMVIFFATYPPIITRAYNDPAFKKRQDSVYKTKQLEERLKHFSDSQYNCNTDKMIELDKKLLELKVIEMEKEKLKSDSIIDMLRRQIKKWTGKKEKHYEIIYKTKKRKS